MLGSCVLISTYREHIKNNLPENTFLRPLGSLGSIKPPITIPFYRWPILEPIEPRSVFLR